MLTPMPKPFNISITVMEPGWTWGNEIVVEVNGHIVATTVCVVSTDDWQEWFWDWFPEQIRRRC